jgi:hypothetical protein
MSIPESDAAFLARIKEVATAKGLTPDLGIMVAAGDLETLGAQFGVQRLSAADLEAMQADAERFAALVAKGVPLEVAKALTPDEAGQVLTLLEGGATPDKIRVDRFDDQPSKVSLTDDGAQAADQTAATDEVVDKLADQVADDIATGRIVPEPAPAPVQARGLIRTGKMAPEDAAKAHAQTFPHLIAELTALRDQAGDKLALVITHRDKAKDRGDTVLADLLAAAAHGLTGTRDGLTRLLSEF